MATQNKSEFRLNINHSEEVDEIFGTPPSDIVRFSIISVTIFLGMLFAASYIVKYAEVINAKIFIRAATPPNPVVAHTTGKITKLFVKENDFVDNNKILGYIESIADHRQVIELSDELYKILDYIKRDNWEELYEYNPAAYTKLGELQAPFQVFVSNVISIKAYLKGGSYDKSSALIQKEIEALHQLKSNLYSQEQIYKSDYQLAMKEFDAKEALYKDKVIAQLEFNQDKSKLLSKQLPLKNIGSSIITNNSNTISKEHELLNIQQGFEAEKSSFIQSLSALLSNIENWKNQYLLRAPVAGQIFFSDIVQENQIASVGQELFYVSPHSSGYVGQMFVSQEGLGKIEVGQAVLISVASYPSNEYGKLKGMISFISSVPNKDLQYLVTVALNKDLQSDRNVKLNFRNDLLGGAEIITHKTRLINKVLFTFQKLMDNHLTK